MKVEYINPFIEASKSVIKMLCGVDVEMGKVHLKSSPFSFSNVIIIIGVVGEIKGQIYFEMPMEVAKKIASTMMGGMPVDELDEISKSAISEMGNMIMGNASTIFANNEISIDITPPTLISGERIEMSSKSPTVVVPLELKEFGTINININAE